MAGPRRPMLGTSGPKPAGQSGVSNISNVASNSPAGAPGKAERSRPMDSILCSRRPDGAGTVRRGGGQGNVSNSTCSSARTAATRLCRQAHSPGRGSGSQSARARQRPSTAGSPACTGSSTRTRAPCARRARCSAADGTRSRKRPGCPGGCSAICPRCTRSAAPGPRLNRARQTGGFGSGIDAGVKLTASSAASAGGGPSTTCSAPASSAGAGAAAQPLAPAPGRTSNRACNTARGSRRRFIASVRPHRIGAQPAQCFAPAAVRGHPRAACPAAAARRLGARPPA